MGMLTKSKTAGGIQEAKDAYEQGEPVWLGRYWDEVISYQGTGAIKGAGQFIGAIESIGWKLTEMSYSWVPAKNRGVTVLMFRRS